MESLWYSLSCFLFCFVLFFFVIYIERFSAWVACECIFSVLRHFENRPNEQ